MPRFLAGAWPGLGIARPGDAVESQAQPAVSAMVDGRPAVVTACAPRIAREPVAQTSGEVVEWWPVQDELTWNDQYAQRYKKTRPRGDTAQKDFDAERASGKVKAASSSGGIKVGTQLSYEQVHKIVLAGGERESADRCAAMSGSISAAFTIMLIDTAQAQADYLAHMAGESGGVLEEIQGEKRSYAPFQGRGAVQVTHPENYAKALGTLQQRRDQIEKQVEAIATRIAELMTARDDAQDAARKQQAVAQIDALHAEVDVLRLQMFQLDAAIKEIAADPAAAARPEYGFLLSAAQMHKTGAAAGTARLGATAAFVGNGPADTWVSGGNAGMSFDERKAQNEAELADIKTQLESATDDEKIKKLKKGAAARELLIRDMGSAKSRGKKKEAVYAAGVRVLSAENAVATTPGTQPPAGAQAVIQPKADHPVAAVANLSASASGGHPLPAARRAQLERGLGVDLGGVQLHTDGTAADTARSLGARAFAAGQNVYFNAGEYQPESDAGFRLLAHEVVHTVQQRGGTPAAALSQPSQPGDASEREADAVADAIANGTTAPVPVGATSTTLALKGRTAADLGYPDTSDPWMYAIAQRNVYKPTPGWIGGSKSVTHADMLALGYTYRGRSGNSRSYHLPGTEPWMTFNVVVNPEVDPDAPDPDDPSNAGPTDPEALAEAKTEVREWQRLTRKTLPIYDQLRALRGAGKGDTDAYQQLVDAGNDLFDEAAEHEQDFHDNMADWREQLADDPEALAELEGLGVGHVESLRSWMDDFDNNRQPGDNQKADDELRRIEQELKRLLEELESAQAEEADAQEAVDPDNEPNREPEPD